MSQSRKKFKRAKHSHSRVDEAKVAKFAAVRRQLPIFPAREAIIEEVYKNNTTVIVGETGSGKTTQIPQYLYESLKESNKLEGNGMIAITQPRRVAAITIAKRVSDEMGVVLGEEVGYTVRFEDCSSDRTKLRYMTDGMLLRESQIDPLLSRYSVIILDEAHERTLHTDVLLGIVKSAQRKRMEKAAEKESQSSSTQPKISELKIVVMSATIESEAFSTFFDGARILYIEGRQFPVDIYYTDEPEADYIDAALTATLQIHIDASSKSKAANGDSGSTDADDDTLPIGTNIGGAVDDDDDGDILVFMTGQEEIESLTALLEDKARYLPPQMKKLIVCPIFAALPTEKQMEVFEPTPPGCRKVVIATNIAETSITINGIKYVIDTGLAKSRLFNPTNGLEALLVTPISKASARQRAGRAGRERAGKCYRLYTEQAYEDLEEYSVPEIQRCDLGTVVLQLKSLGINDVLSFEFMSKPPVATIKRSLENLYALEALNDKGELTELGKRMAGFPLEPMFSKALIKSIEFSCVEEILTIVAMLSVENIFYSPQDKRQQADRLRRRFTSAYGDHLMMLNVWRAYREAKGDPQWCFSHFINVRAMNKITEVRRQLREFLVSMRLIAVDSCITCQRDLTPVRQCLTSAFFLNAAVKMPGNSRIYRTLADNQEVRLHPACSLLYSDKLPGCVIFNHLVFTSKSYIREVCSIESSWLPELAPKFYSGNMVSDSSVPVFNASAAGKGKQQKQYKVQISA